MQTRASRILTSGTILLLFISVVTASAEDRLQAFVSGDGRIVYTNLVENQTITTSTPIIRVPASDVPASIRSLVDTISSNHGLDPELVRAVIKTESNFNRFAVSSKGALGLMQLIPSTGRRYGVRDFFDPEQNIDGGVRYLKFLLEKFNGDLDLSLAAYNAGENLVGRLGRVPAIPETTNYVHKIRTIYKKESTPVVAAPGNGLNAMTEAAVPEPPKIYKSIDSRGVVHHSNIEPSN